MAINSKLLAVRKDGDRNPNLVVGLVKELLGGGQGSMLLAAMMEEEAWNWMMCCF